MILQFILLHAIMHDDDKVKLNTNDDDDDDDDDDDLSTYRCLLYLRCYYVAL